MTTAPDGIACEYCNHESEPGDLVLVHEDRASFHGLYACADTAKCDKRAEKIEYHDEDDES